MAELNRLSSKEVVISMAINAAVYTVLLCLFMHFLAPKKIEDCPRCKQVIAQYRASKQAAKIPIEEARYQESVYSHSGGINPGFKKIVSNAPNYQEAPKQRAYEQQLAQYQAMVAEQERKRLEEERLLAEEEAKEKALMEKERLERLEEERELQKSTAISTTGGVGPSKTFTAPKTQKPQPKTQQKTVIGTLKTSKLGESSFQNGRF